MNNIKLDALEGYEYYGNAGWWDGFAAGARSAADAAKDKLLRDILNRRQQAPAAGPQPVPNPTEEASA